VSGVAYRQIDRSGERRDWLHHNKCLQQKHVLAEKRRAFFPLIEMFPVMGARFHGERLYFDMSTPLMQRQLGENILEKARRG
jgi:hypothetical protein